MLDDPNTVYEPYELHFAAGILHVLANPGELAALAEAIASVSAVEADKACRLLMFERLQPDALPGIG